MFNLHEHMRWMLLEAKSLPLRRLSNWEGNIHIYTNKYKTGYNQGLNSEG